MGGRLTATWGCCSLSRIRKRRSSSARKQWSFAQAAGWRTTIWRRIWRAVIQMRPLHRAFWRCKSGLRRGRHLIILVWHCYIRMIWRGRRGLLRKRGNWIRGIGLLKRIMSMRCWSYQKRLLGLLDELLVEMGVFAAGGDQLAVGAALDDFAGVDYEDEIGGHDGAEAVRYDEGGSTGEEFFE